MGRAKDFNIKNYETGSPVELVGSMEVFGLSTKVILHSTDTTGTIINVNEATGEIAVEVYNNAIKALTNGSFYITSMFYYWKVIE